LVLPLFHASLPIAPYPLSLHDALPIFLGRSHYRIFHTTGTAGTLAAAAAVGRLLRLSPQQTLHAFGSAGTQSAGLWEFLRDAARSEEHTSELQSRENLVCRLLLEKKKK